MVQRQMTTRQVEETRYTFDRDDLIKALQIYLADCCEVDISKGRWDHEFFYNKDGRLNIELVHTVDHEADALRYSVGGEEKCQYTK